MRQVTEITVAQIEAQLAEYRKVLQGLVAERQALQTQLDADPKNSTLQGDLRTLASKIGAAKGKITITLMDAYVYGIVHHQNGFEILPEVEKEQLIACQPTATRIGELVGTEAYVPFVDGIKNSEKLQPGKGQGEQFIPGVFEGLTASMFDKMEALNLGVFSRNDLTLEDLAKTSKRALAAKVPFMDDKGYFTKAKTVITTCGIDVSKRDSKEASEFCNIVNIQNAEGRSFEVVDLNEPAFSKGYSLIADNIAKAHKKLAPGEMLYAPPIGMGIFLKAFDCDARLHIVKDLESLPGDKMPDGVKTNAAFFYNPATPDQLVYYKNNKTNDSSCTCTKLNLQPGFRGKTFDKAVYEPKVKGMPVDDGQSFAIDSFNLSDIQAMTKEKLMHENIDIKQKAMKCVYKAFNNAMKTHGQQMTIIIWEGERNAKDQLAFANQVAQEEGFENLHFVIGNVKSHDFILNAGDNKSAGGLFAVVKDGYVPVDEQFHQESMAAMVLTNMNPELNVVLAQYCQSMLLDESAEEKDTYMSEASLSSARDAMFAAPVSNPENAAKGPSENPKSGLGK